jgi:hypothetical protein
MAEGISARRSDEVDIDTIFKLSDANVELFRRMMADIEQADMALQPEGVKNHATWQAGHLATVRSAVAGILGAKPTVLAAWGLLFGPNTTPITDASKYPSKQELLETFAKAQDSFKAALKAASPELLAQPNPIESLRWFMPTVGALGAGILTTHDCLHLGQLSVWRRTLGLPRVI